MVPDLKDAGLIHLQLSNQHVWSSRGRVGRWSMKYLLNLVNLLLLLSVAESTFITLLLTLSKLRGLYAFLFLLLAVSVYICQAVFIIIFVLIWRRDDYYYHGSSWHQGNRCTELHPALWNAVLMNLYKQNNQ